MKLVYSHPDTAVTHLVKNELENLGIEAEIRGSDAVGLLGAYVGAGNWNELWIVDEGRLPEAVRAIRAVIDEDGPGERAAWTCPQCGETIEPQFAACWNCGAERADA